MPETITADMFRKITFSEGKAFLFDDDYPFGSDENMVDITPHEVIVGPFISGNGWTEAPSHSGNEVQLEISTKCAWLADSSVNVGFELRLYENGEHVGFKQFNMNVPKDGTQPMNLRLSSEGDNSYAGVGMVVSNRQASS